MKEDDPLTAIDKATRLLWPEPVQWLPGHFERTLRIARNFYASGVGRIPRAKIRKEIENFKKLIDEFEASLSGWGALFSERDGGALAVNAARAALPALKEAAANAGGKVTIRSGPGAASMVDDWLYPKEILALGVWLAARKLDQERRKRDLEQIAEILWQSSDLSDTELQRPARFSIFTQIPPARSMSWDNAFDRVRTVTPKRSAAGQIEATFHDVPLMCSAGDLASYFLLHFEQPKNSSS